MAEVGRVGNGPTLVAPITVIVDVRKPCRKPFWSDALFRNYEFGISLSICLTKIVRANRTGEHLLMQAI
jgi:hypothetical protein